MKWTIRISAILAPAILFASGVSAQVSGVTGDAIPDLYYFPVDGLIQTTSFGDITRPAGTMVLDTDQCDACGDIKDAVAVFIGGPDITTVNAATDPPPGCYLCDGMNLPGADALGNTSTWTLGYSGGSSQWIRTEPLQGLGFRGVVGTGYVDGADAFVTPWPGNSPPFVFFPPADTGLANYGPGLTDADFTSVFDDGNGEATWNVQFASDDGSTLFTNVTVVPEPAAASLLSLAGLALLGLRRRS